jgi:cyclophilin family peptidyl-prolyl cis-trans isomerase
MKASIQKPLLLVTLASLFGLLPGFQAAPVRQPVCVLQTDLGTMVFKFFEAEAPQTTKQFQKLVRDGFYNGKDFYRIVKGHVIQAGGGLAPKLPPEFNKRPHLVGTVGLGRDEDINSGDSEFYICIAPRPHLDGRYTVFGQLIEGLDILEKISTVEVEEKWEGPDKKLAMHKPKKPVLIKKAWIEERDLSPKVPGKAVQ